MLEPRAMSGTPREPPRRFEAPSVSQLFKRSDAELRMCHKWVGTLAVLLRNVALAKSEGRTSLDEPRERGRVLQRAPQREHERRSRSPRQRDMQSPPAQRDMRSPMSPRGHHFLSPVPGRERVYGMRSPLPERPRVDVTKQLQPRGSVRSALSPRRIRSKAAPAVKPVPLLGVIPKKPLGMVNHACSGTPSRALQTCAHPMCFRDEHASLDFDHFAGFCCNACRSHYHRIYMHESSVKALEDIPAIQHGTKCQTPFVNEIPNRKARRQAGYNVDQSDL